MDSQKIGNWMQSLTAVAVLIGLGLVVWELQQVKTLTRAQLSSETFAINIGYQASLLGDAPIEVLAKACMEPENLDAQDLILLGYHYDSVQRQIVRLYLLDMVADLSSDLEAPGWEGYGEKELNSIALLLELLRTEPGKLFYEEKTDWWPDEMKSFGERISEVRKTLPSCKEDILGQLSSLAGS